MTRLLTTMVVALSALAVVLLATPTSGSVPIQVPTALQASKSAPRALRPPASTAMPLLEVPLTPEARSAGLYYQEEFPSEPQPRPNVNQEPLPLSPPGTYLHSAVLIQGVMYIYGGVASYEADKYFNDLWLFDFGASEFVQLQGNYVPPPPTRAGLSAGDAEAFAPTDVPEMPNLATAPRHETSTSEALHPNANPSSPFLPTRRAQHPVRVTALEHLYLKDAEKPTATGLTMKQIYGQTHSSKPGFIRDAERDALKRKIAKQRKEYERLEKQLKEQEKEEAKAEAEKRKVLGGHAFLETQVEIGAETAVRHRHRMLSKVLQSIIDARRTKNPSTTSPRDNSGTVYSDPRFHRDGVAADYAYDGRPTQDAAAQQHHPNTRTPESAAEDARERMPHALQDFWAYDLDDHTWTLANVSSSQPLAHSPWLTPAQLNDPVFKDPLPVLLPPTRRLHTAVVMKDRMIVFGGVSYNNLILGDLWIYSPADASWIEASADGPGGSPILPREGHTAVTTKDGLSMVVFGGVSYGFLPFNDLWTYSAVDNAWYRLSNPDDQTAPMQRWLHTAVYHSPSDGMVVFGGITAHYVPLNDVHVYSVAANVWEQKATLGTPPFPRMMHTAVTINDLMLVTGGAANNLPMDDVFVLDLKTWRWKEILQTGGYPFARTGATAIVLSPAKRAGELGELEDLSEDADDPHLEWKADLEKLNARPIVGSFSSEGVTVHEEQPGNIAGLDAIAFPAHPVVSGDQAVATQRPIYRYRKHAKNAYYFVLFGGAAATTAPADETHVQRQIDEQGPPGADGRQASFLEVEEDASVDEQAEETEFVEVSSTFSPGAASQHKSAQIGQARANRVRARRESVRRVTPGQNVDSREGGTDPQQYGPYDERRVSEEAKPISESLATALDTERTMRLGSVRPVGLSRAPFCATFPWCQQTPAPPSLAVLPAPEDPRIVKQEMARLDPLVNLPQELVELKKDPHRFGEVFQSIYDRNQHNEKLSNKMGTREAAPAEGEDQQQ